MTYNVQWLSMGKNKDETRKDDDMDREIIKAIECVWTIRDRLRGAQPGQQGNVAGRSF